MKRLLVPIFLLFSVLPSTGHSWYPVECCHDKDCHPVPCESLSELPDGKILYTDESRNHIVYPKYDVKPSQDSKCHVCYNEYNKYPYCVFIQLGT